MANNEMIRLIEEINAYEEIIAEYKLELEAMKDEVKEEMERRQTEELVIGQYIVRFTSILSTRFDTKRFKEKFGEDVYKAFTKEVKSRRFTIA